LWSPMGRGQRIHPLSNQPTSIAPHVLTDAEILKYSFLSSLLLPSLELSHTKVYGPLTHVERLNAAHLLSTNASHSLNEYSISYMERCRLTSCQQRELDRELEREER